MVNTKLNKEQFIVKALSYGYTQDEIDERLFELDMLEKDGLTTLWDLEAEFLVPMPSSDE